MSSLPLAESIRETIYELCVLGVRVASQSQTFRPDSDFAGSDTISFEAAPLLLVQAMLWPIEESELLRGVGVAESEGDVVTTRLLDWKQCGCNLIRASGERTIAILAGKEDGYPNSWRLHTLPLLGFMGSADLNPSCFNIYLDGIPSLKLTPHGFRMEKNKLHGAMPKRGRPPLSQHGKTYLKTIWELHEETRRWAYSEKLKHFQLRYPNIENVDQLRGLIDRAAKQRKRDGRK